MMGRQPETVFLQLDIDGGSATLPMFACANEIVGIEFANYGIALGSGSIDNLSVSLMEADQAATKDTPEMASLGLLVVGGLVLVCAWMVRRRGVSP